MKETKSKTKSNLWIGIDFHKKTWSIHFRSESCSGNPFNMEPDADTLHHKINKEYKD